MIRRLICLSLTLVALATNASDTGHPVTLWKVSGEQNSVYLMGSVHLLRASDYPLPVVLDTAYADADVIVMEIDMDDLNPLAAQATLSKHGLLRDGSTLSDLMGDDLYQEALVASESVEIPLEMLSKTEPWYAAMTIEIMLLNRIGFDPTLGIEMQMLTKATADGKAIEGFETVEEQIAFLDSMSLSAQRAMLLSTLTEGAQLAERMDDLITAWRHGDIALLEDGMLAELADHAELEKVLVTDRNRRWVDRIEELLDDQENYLVVVGALHLIGRNGVPILLDELGYDVHQLSEPPSVR